MIGRLHPYLSDRCSHLTGTISFIRKVVMPVSLRRSSWIFVLNIIIRNAAIQNQVLLESESVFVLYSRRYHP